MKIFTKFYKLFFDNFFSVSYNKEDFSSVNLNLSQQKIFSVIEFCRGGVIGTT